MKQSNVYTLGLFLLVLLVSHEGITLANNIRNGVNMQQQLHLHNTVTTMMSAMESVDNIDDNLSFLEVQDMQGMSMEAYATHEIKEIHKSLKESFTFDQSPILNEVGNLKEIHHT